uniref:Uncharacterized protein n=1 Tax=Arundo donax TaxID=35708 RepID=A0A0A9CKX9_ARUDO
MLSWIDGPIIGKLQKFSWSLSRPFVSVIIDELVTSHNKKLTIFCLDWRKGLQY